MSNILSTDNSHILHELADSPARFINRELSWLAFNSRVIEEASNPNHPLLERVKFLSISGSNLDEFYMIRVAGVREQVENGVKTLSNDGLAPSEQLRLIKSKGAELIREQQRVWNDLKKHLAKEKIEIVDSESLKSRERELLRSFFLTDIFPALSPLAIDPAHPFPFLSNLSISLILKLESRPDSKHHSKNQYMVLPIPAKLDRFVRIPNSKYRFVLLEQVILLFLDILLPNFELKEHGIFRVIRDSELEVSEEAEDLLRLFEKAVKERRRGEVIRLGVGSGMPNELKNLVEIQMGVKDSDVVEIDGLLGVANLSEIYKIEREDLKFPTYIPRFPERVLDYDGDTLAAIEAKDMLIHHPFESFDVVVQFLKQAASDPDVVAIKQTLYRTTSEKSPIVQALKEAAEAGKSVTALIELKARFDEETNMQVARELEKAGAQVVYGFVNLKTHTKVSLVVKKIDGKMRSYVHFGTGNYHPITAKVYTDLSFFTCNPNLCRDAAYLFNYLTGYAPPRKFKKVTVAPLNLREKIISLIQEEIDCVKSGSTGNIWMKMNALVDSEVIDKLYEASQAGVKITLIVRGICCLRPQIKGLSDNIIVKSIVGRFLEHSRIYCFGGGNKLPSKNAKVFISSADIMPRNFDRRVEILVPIENPTVHEQIIGQIMFASVKDERQSWELNSDGTYKRLSNYEKSFSAHEYFMTNPSLSGRGKAGKRKRKNIRNILNQ